MLEQIERITRYEAGARSGEDAEDLHKMRVATRRLRVAFRIFGKKLNAVSGLEMPVHDVQVLARALGAVRDLDVFAERLNATREHAALEHASALQRLREDRLLEREPARRVLFEALDGGVVSRLSDEFGALLRDLLRSDAPSGKRARKALRKAGVRLVSKGLRRFRRTGERLQAPTSEELHDVRIEAKRFRYTCEFMRPVFGEALDEPIARATAVQDALGELHDADLLALALLEDVQRLSAERPEDVAAIASLATQVLVGRDQTLDLFRSAWTAIPKRTLLRRRMRGAGASDNSGDGSPYPL